MEFEYLNPDQQVTTITRVSYRVLRREEFINDKFATTNPFWSHDWDVGMAFPKGEGIPLPFISNDGKYLVLVSVTRLFLTSQSCESTESTATAAKTYSERTS
jgi:hypothetical protein